MSPSEGKRSQNHYVGRQSSKSTSSDSSLTLDEERGGENIDLRQSYGFPEVNELLKFCFGKKFALAAGYTVFPRGDDVKLYSSEKWTSDELGEFRKLKTQLNSVKNMLNDYDLNDWHQFTRATNPADLVMRRLRNEMKVEFLTQAWCKVYELVSEYNLVPNAAKVSKKLHSVHLCEAPGAFVASLNHFLKTNYPDIEWSWTANSLNPFYEGNTPSQMINDDRFMMQTLKNWHFGRDETGDITHPDYPSSLAEKCGDSLAHLVTADGSFDCQDNPDEQESTVSWLHLKETLTALKVLRKGGFFVIKMFTFFECETICLLYLLYMLFRSLQVMKPATSKEGNSEVYVVCREFKGAEVAEPYLAQLYSISEETHNKLAMFSYCEVNRFFKKVLVQCAEDFVQKQMSVIKRNIRLFERRDNKEFRHHFEFVQLKLWQTFVDKYDVKPIHFSQNIVPLQRRSYQTPKRKNVMEKRGCRRGSHAQRLLRKSLSKDEVFAKISEEFRELEAALRVQPMRMPHVEIPVEDWGVVLGKPLEAVMSSQFCHGSLMRMRNEIIDTITIGEYNKVSQPQRRYDNEERDYRRICYFRETFSASNRSYSEAQVIAFHQIYEVLQELNNGDDLVFVGFPLLTRFNINILCFLKQLFDDIEVMEPFVLYMRRLNFRKLQKWGPKLDDILRNYSKQRAVQSFFPIDYLTTGPLHTWLVEVNNFRVYHEIKLLMKYGSS